MAAGSPDPLTPRETRVLELLRSGLSNKQIARVIDVSEQTVKYHLKNLYSKLGAQGRAHAVALRSEPRAPEPRMAAPDEARAAVETPLSPLALVQRTRRLHGDREAVIDGDRRFTYAQFFERCERWAGALHALGLQGGERVAVVSPNTHALLEQFYAVPQLGAVIVPLHRGLTPENLAGLIRHCGARVVCASREYLASIEAWRAQFPEVTHYVALDGAAPPGWLDYERLLAEGAAAPRHTIGEQDLLSINYTSGSTQAPQGAMLTHRNLWTNIVGTLLHWPMHAHDRYLWLLPMFHANGWGFVWTVTAAGATHICARGTQSQDIADLVQRERVTLMCAPKSMLVGMGNVPEDIRARLPRGLRVLTAGASPSASTIERVEQRLGWEVTHAYGLTETSPFLALCELPAEAQSLAPAQRARLKARQGAELLTSGELRVVDEEGQDVPRDGATLGEIVVRGPGVMRGYYRDPQATARVLAGGVFHTGDAAVMHADGTIEIRDRFKDIIISGDELISSLEVEEALMRHPAVCEVAVVGVPDARLGESVQAFVVLRDGCSLSQAQLRAFACEQLAPFKVPPVFRQLASLPRTSTGKVRKQSLREGGAGAGDCPSE